MVNLDKLTYAADPRSVAEAAATPGYRFVQAEIADPAAVHAAFAEHRPDAVLHLAAESHVDRSITSPGEFVRTNVVGTLTLLQAALGHWRTLGARRRSASNSRTSPLRRCSPRRRPTTRVTPLNSSTGKESPAQRGLAPISGLSGYAIFRASATIRANAPGVKPSRALSGVARCCSRHARLPAVAGVS